MISLDLANPKLRACKSRCNEDEKCQYLFFSPNEKQCLHFDKTCENSTTQPANLLIENNDVNFVLRCTKRKNWGWELISNQDVKGSLYSKRQKRKLELTYDPIYK